MITGLLRGKVGLAVDTASGGLLGWAVGLAEGLGGPGTAVVVGLDAIFPPIPSEFVLPLAGFSASQGTAGLVSTVIWATIGSLAGATVMYMIGMMLGRERTRALAVRIPLVKVSDVDRAEAWFARHGGKAVLFGRMIPLFRSFISLPAGVERMPLAKFLLYTAVGSGIWNTVFVLAGYLLGENWHKVEQYSDTLQVTVVALVGLALVWFVVSRLRRRKETSELE
jgi:membrane protein DedA with SNARE-associated domain